MSEIMTSCCSNKKNTCCSDEILFEDLSKVKNPTEPKQTITLKFLKEFESYLEEYDIGYVNGISKLFLHDYKFDFDSAIVISYEMYQEILDVGAGKKAEELNDELYEHFGKITYKISDYLRKNGYETYVAHPREEKINFSALAKKANMGNIGKSGLFISPKFGPKQKIAAILINIENLPQSESKYEWMREYCEYCNSCIRKCPEKALSYLNNETRLNENICIGCSEGCTECIKACPFYEKGYNKVHEKYKKIKNKKVKSKT